jgi:hypothetical protein
MRNQDSISWDSTSANIRLANISQGKTPREKSWDTKPSSSQRKRK